MGQSQQTANYDAEQYWLGIRGERQTDFDSFINKQYKSFKSNGSPDDVAETFVLLKEGNTYVTKGSKSGRNTYKRKGNKLQHKWFGNYVCSFMHPNGELLWSHGYTSWPLDISNKTEQIDRVKPSNVTFEYWLGKNAKSFKTGDSENNIAESFLFIKEGDTYLTLGEKSGRNPYTKQGSKLIH